MEKYKEMAGFQRKSGKLPLGPAVYRSKLESGPFQFDTVSLQNLAEIYLNDTYRIRKFCDLNNP